MILFVNAHSLFVTYPNFIDFTPYKIN